MNKRIVYTLWVAVGIFFMTALSCKNDKNYAQKIIGTWVVDSQHIAAPNVPDSIAKANHSKGQKWSFKSDNTFSVSINNNTNGGNYSISNTGENYFMYLNNGNATHKEQLAVQITTLTDKNLEMVSNHGPATITFYLTKL